MANVYLREIIALLFFIIKIDHVRAVCPSGYYENLSPNASAKCGKQKENKCKCFQFGKHLFKRLFFLETKIKEKLRMFGTFCKESYQCDYNRNFKCNNNVCSCDVDKYYDYEKNICGRAEL